MNFVFIALILCSIVLCTINAQRNSKNEEVEVLSDAQLGMRELQKTLRDPKILAEALEMLKDPEIAKEVKAMMEDPAFKAEMKQFTENAAFKEAASKAAEEIENLQMDPVKMKSLKAELFSG